MPEEIICPECGGVIGGEPGTGRKVCDCFTPRRTVTTEPRPMMPEAALDPANDPSSLGEKICRVCGQNLKGHRRYKDVRGYTCVPCHEAEQERDAVPGDLIPCTECGRKLKIDGITTYDNRVMCKRCAAEQKELHKFKPPAVLETRAKEAEKQTLRNWLIVAGVLLVIIVLSYFGLIGR